MLSTEVKIYILKLYLKTHFVILPEFRFLQKRNIRSKTLLQY